MKLFKVMESMVDAITGKGVDKNTIEAAEDALGVSFSQEYRAYLERYGIAAVNGHELTGICKSDRTNVVSVTQSAKRIHETANDWYVVEQTNIDGIIIWQASNGTVYQTAPNAKPKKLCESLAEYIKM